MVRTSIVLFVLLAVTSASADNPPPIVTAYAAHSLSASIDPTAGLRPPDPNASVCVGAPVPPVPITDSPPPFGTVVQEWPLLVQIANGGITWRRDAERFYLIDQGYQGHAGVWSCDPFDPSHTARRENWVLPNMGDSSADIPWGIAWDSDSGCYWISSILDGSIYRGCYYTRIRKTSVGDTWRWFSENPGDTWLVGDSSCGGAGSMYWMAGSEKWLGRDYFACAPVATGYPYNNVWEFDPYTKTSIGRCLYGGQYSERGCTLVPWDSNYILTCGWNNNAIVKRDSTGRPLASVTGGQSDIALWIPQDIGPDDTVFMYGICYYPDNTMQKISVGLLWGQLGPGQAIGEPGWPASVADGRLRVEPNPCRGSATIRFHSPLPTPYSLSITDVSGRVVQSTICNLKSAIPLDLRSLPAGVYVLRLNAGTFTCSAKMIVQH